LQKIAISPKPYLCRLTLETFVFFWKFWNKFIRASQYFRRLGEFSTKNFWKKILKREKYYNNSNIMTANTINFAFYYKNKISTKENLLSRKFYTALFSDKMTEA